jgi:lysozyme family protein
LAAFRAEVDDTASAEVKKIQERLVALGHTVVVDGVIGPKTLAAIAAALGVD